MQKDPKQRLAELGSRIAAVQSAKRMADPTQNVQRGPLGPEIPGEAEFMQRMGGRWHPTNPLVPLVSLILFARSLRRTR